MKHPTVYELLRTLKGDRHVERLVQALDELAGRVESVSGFDVTSHAPTGLRLAGDGTGPSTSSRAYIGRTRAWDLSELELPDPSTGTLPLFPGVSEFDALQSAATSTAAQLRSKAEQHAWRSWVMSPSHFVCVVHAAWLLLALVFKQDSQYAKPLQDFVFQQLAQHFVSQVLAGQACVENAAVLWTQAISEAACIVLRSAFAGATELQDPQLQQLLQRQLRLWITGVLPSDAASSLIMAAQEHEGDQDCDDLARRRYTAAPFVSIKPGPLVSSYMASKDIKPVDLLHKPGTKVTHLTVPYDQLQQQVGQQQQQQQQQQPSLQQTVPQQQLTHGPSAKGRHVKLEQEQASAVSPAAGTIASLSYRPTTGPPPQRGLGKQYSSGGFTSRQQPGSNNRTSKPTGATIEPSAADATSSGTASYAARAAECLAAASDAAEQYELSKKSATAAASKGSKAVKQHIRQLQQKRNEMLLGTRATVQDASNSISGWLSDLPAASSATTSAATDAQCKAQRQLMASHLRSTDWRMEHAFNATVHDKCLDMAAAVTAAAACAPAASGLPVTDSGAANANVTGGKWAAVAGNNMISRRLNMTEVGGGGAADTASHDVKVMKAARAIVEDVQRKFAASPTRLSTRQQQH